MRTLERHQGFLVCFHRVRLSHDICTPRIVCMPMWAQGRFFDLCVSGFSGSHSSRYKWDWSPGVVRLELKNYPAYIIKGGNISCYFGLHIWTVQSQYWSMCKVRSDLLRFFPLRTSPCPLVLFLKVTDALCQIFVLIFFLRLLVQHAKKCSHFSHVLTRQ